MLHLHDKDYGSIVSTPTGDLPLHLLPQASDPIYHPDDPMQSCFFVSTFEDFQKLSRADKRRIFRDRHIVVTGVPTDGSMRWDEETFELVAPLDRLVPAQSECVFNHIRDLHLRNMNVEMENRDLPGAGKDTQPITECTVREIYEAGKRPTNGAGVNGLDFPKGRSDIAFIPGMV